MIETKFRTYNPKNNSMIYYTWEDLINTVASIDYCGPRLNDTMRELISISEFDYSPAMRMQYTGKQDMEGKDIYEGDIIYKELYDSDDYAFGIYDFTGVIEEDPDGMGWMISSIDENDINFHQIKIIGNKYQNPDLL